MTLALKGVIQGKQQKTSFLTEVAIHAKKLLKIVHFDVCRSMKIPSIGRIRYFIAFIDDFLRYRFTPLKQRVNISQGLRSLRHL